MNEKLFMDQIELTMNPEYFIGYLPLTGPIVDPPASAAARQGELKQLWCCSLSRTFCCYFLLLVTMTVPLTTTTMLHRGDSEVRPRYNCQLAKAESDPEAVVPSIREITNTVQLSPQQQPDTMAGQPQTRAQQRRQQAQALQATRTSYRPPLQLPEGWPFRLFPCLWAPLLPLLPVVCCCQLFCF